MRRLTSFLFIIAILFSSKVYSQTFADSVTSGFLKIKMPIGTTREITVSTIATRTALLDSVTIVKDYPLNKYPAESFYIPNYDSLKSRLNKNNFTISKLSGTNSFTTGGTTYYTIKKDSFNYLAVITPQGQQTMVSMKPLTVLSSSQSFIQTNKLVASDRKNSMEFGREVAITNNYAVVGVKLEERDAEGKNPLLAAGAAYIYERGPDGQWKEVQKIVSADRAVYDNFGSSVAISDNVIVVGAVGDRKDATGRNEATNEGSAYVFERGSDGVWKQTQKLLSSGREGYNYFGTSVGIDGNIIVVGAPGNSRDSTDRQEGYVGDAGCVFVFEKRGNNWRRVYKLIAHDRAPGGDNLGNSVAINGNLVIAGAWQQDFDINGTNKMENAGAAYIWERMEDGKWTRSQKLAASDRSPFDEFGFSVAIDGDNAVVGARGVTLDPKDENNNGYTGEAYIFSRNENGDWKEVKAIRPEDRKGGEYYGSSVGVSGNYAFVGAWRGSTKNPYIGVIYIYWKDAQGKWTQSQKIAAGDAAIYANFSTGAAIHHGFIISGSPMETRDLAGKNEQTNAGAVYIFMRTEKNPSTPTTTKQPSKSSGKKTN